MVSSIARVNNSSHARRSSRSKQDLSPSSLPDHNAISRLNRHSPLSPSTSSRSEEPRSPSSFESFLKPHPQVGVMDIQCSSGMRPRTFSLASGSTVDDIIDQQISNLPTVSESDPLLSVDPNDVDIGLEKVRLKDLLPEMRTLRNYGIPIITTHMLENTLLIVSVVSVGHLGTIELASASLANITANCAGLSIIIGFASALDTLCPQAFTSDHPERTSLYAIRTSILLCLFLIPELVIFWNAEPIFLFLRQDPLVAQSASKYLRVISLGLPGYATFEVTRRWLQAQQLMFPATLVVLFVAPLNVLLSYLLVWGPDGTRLGFIGAPIATMISFNLMGFISALYCIFIAPKTAWGGFTREAFQELGPNFKFGLSGFTMVASEWWCWEIVGLASSLLGPTTLAAQSVITTISTLVFQFPYATSAAAAVRCGNLLGAGLPCRARLAAYSAFACGLLVGITNMLFMIVFRTGLGRLFSSEPEVIRIVADILPLVALFQIPDSLAAVMGGVLRGVGKPNIGAIINSTGYYLLGLPIGLILTFSSIDLGPYGLWTGMTIAVTATAMTCTTYVLRMDFEQAVVLARERMHLVYETLSTQTEETECRNYGSTD